jgi:DNA invertase Pin-like site-specific DNA recombinase
MKTTGIQTTATDVIALIRVSTPEQAQDDKAGIDRQRTANRETALRNGLHIRREVVAIDVSGRHVLQDPQFQGIFAELSDPTLAGVVVAEQSRLIRPENYGDVAIFDLFANNKKLIYTPSETVDPTNSAGRMSLTLRAMMSREELTTLRERMNGGKQEKRERGQHPGGPQALPRTVRYVRERADAEKKGSQKVTGWRWELVPLEADRIRRAFELLIAGDSYELIAEKIGGGWTGVGLSACLKNPIHIGIRRYVYKAGAEYRPQATTKNPNPKPRRKSVRKEEAFEIPTRLELESGAKPPLVEPIVSLEVFDRAQAIMAARLVRWRRSKERNTNRDRFLGLGTVECSCGKRMYAKYGGRGPHLDRYYCSTGVDGAKHSCGAATIRRTDLDEALEEMMATLADDNFILAAVDVMLKDNHTPTESAELMRYREALGKMESGKKELLKLVTTGIISADDYKASMREHEREVKALATLVPVQRPRISPREIATLFVRLFQGFRHLTYLAKRTLLRGAIGSVSVDSHGKAIVTVTVQGGYLGMGVNSKVRSTASSQFDSIPDLTFTFPQPIEIPDTFRDRRLDNGHHPASVATRLIPGNTIRAEALARI